MPETNTLPKPAESAPAGKVERTHRVIHTLSMTFGIVGAVGTAAVWLAANFLVGEVEISPDKVVSAVLVKVYDSKGQEATYHLNRFQLMPGNYHLEVTAGDGAAQHADITVEFAKKCTVPITVVSSAGSAAPGPAADADDTAVNDRSEQPHKRHWWQFWRK
jgi:hypothetical protein